MQPIALTGKVDEALFDCIWDTAAVVKKSLFDLICSKRMMYAINKVLAEFPRCQARLTCLRLILLLTQWPRSLEHLLEAEITDPLLLICSEAEDIHIHNHTAAMTLTTATVDANCVHSMSDDESVVVAVTIEETILVCNSLANTCHAKKEYAKRLFSNGLLSIMLPLISSTHIEVSLQVVRCISALSGVIPSSQNKVSTVYKEALTALSNAIKSPSNMVKKEAITGIANLAAAADDYLKDSIVVGPLKEIVGILNDYDCDPDMRSAAELVLRNIGFTDGIRDVETCNFDVQLLSDWFNLKMSLQPQVLSRRVIERWITDDLFPQDAVHLSSPSAAYATIGSACSTPVDKHHYAVGSGTSSSSSSSSRYNNDAIHTASGNSSPALSPAHSYEEESASIDELYNRLSIDCKSHQQHSMSRNSFNIFSGGYHRTPSPLGGLHLPINLSFNQLQRHLTESLSRFLPFCLNKQSGSHYHTHTQSYKQSDSQKKAGVALTPVIPNSMRRATSETGAVSSSGAQHQRHLYGTSSGIVASSVYEGADKPPANVLHLLELFYPSKLHQLFYLGMMSLCSDVELSKYDTTGASLPTPFDVSTLYLPNRSYSFRLLARVIQRLIEPTDSQLDSNKSDKRWSLLFQDVVSSSDEHFHESLLTILRQCPQIVSLSFNNYDSDTPQKNAKMGHLAGHVPNSIRFLNFNGSLCSESVQALCILLKRNNATYNDVLPSVDMTDDFSCKTSYTSQGLVGLSISKTALDGRDIKYILELLVPVAVGDATTITPSDKEDDRNSINSNNSNAGSSSNACATTAYAYKGLKYLDLTEDNLNDTSCGAILAASTVSPLLGLELSGNNIQKGLLFLESSAFLDSLKSMHSNTYLKHLGLSRCSLSSHMISAIFACLIDNKTLTSLDMSHNDITSNDIVHKSLRPFLFQNKGLRALDLSYNKLTEASTPFIYLGLLQNHYMLMLSLIGNVAVLQHADFILIQDQLSCNRKRYARQIHAVNRSYVQASAAAVAVSDGANGGSASRNTGDSSDAINRIYNADEDLPVAEVYPAVTAIDTSAAVATTVSASLIPVGSLVQQLDTAVALTSPTIANAVTAATVSADDISSNSSDTSRYMLNVFFSCPLAWRDRHSTLHPLTTLDYRMERDSIVQVFKEVHREISVCFDFATTDSLRTCLSMGCRAIHFSGHGHSQCLNFEDGAGGLHQLTVTTLRDLLLAGDVQLDFVFVSACHSRTTGEAFIEAGVKHVVCVKVDAEIQDSAAMAFTRAFYLALLNGKTVRQSFNIAREALKASPYVNNSVLEGAKFILLPDDDNNSNRHNSHNESIFTCPLIPVWPSQPSHCYMGKGIEINPDGNKHLPPPPPDMIGRECDMYKVINQLYTSNRRLVSLIGDRGIGKTAVAAAVCNYMVDRNMFEDGVIYVRSKSCRKHTELLETLLSTIGTGPRILSNRLQAAILALSDRDSNGSGKHSQGNKSISEFELQNKRIKRQEELIVSSLGNLKVLIVLDHIDDLLQQEREESLVDLNFFFSNLFERCANVKVLVTNPDSSGLQPYGVVNYTTELGPLNLTDSIQLFTRLAPSLSSSLAAKKSFVSDVLSLLPSKQTHVTINSRGLTPIAAAILSLFEYGHPAKIVKMACESTTDSIESLKLKCTQLQE